jgi:hypothetical protein
LESPLTNREKPLVKHDDCAPYMCLGKLSADGSEPAQTSPNFPRPYARPRKLFYNSLSTISPCIRQQSTAICCRPSAMLFSLAKKFYPRACENRLSSSHPAVRVDRPKFVRAATFQFVCLVLIHCVSYGLTTTVASLVMLYEMATSRCSPRAFPH